MLAAPKVNVLVHGAAVKGNICLYLFNLVTAIW